MDIPKPIFKVGDVVTYKSKEECGKMSHSLTKGYNSGGTDHAGFEGIVHRVGEYVDYARCFSLIVSAMDEGTYLMLECEFREYDSNNCDYELY